MHHEVVCGDQGFVDHHPAGVADPLEQRVGQRGDVHIGVLGGLDQVWGASKRAGAEGHMVDIIQCVLREMIEWSNDNRWVGNDKQEGVRVNVLGLLHLIAALSRILISSSVSSKKQMCEKMFLLVYTFKNIFQKIIMATRSLSDFKKT